MADLESRTTKGQRILAASSKPQRAGRGKASEGLNSTLRFQKAPNQEYAQATPFYSLPMRLQNGYCCVRRRVVPFGPLFLRLAAVTSLRTSFQRPAARLKIPLTMTMSLSLW